MRNVAHEYGQALFEHYGASRRLARERLSKYPPKSETEVARVCQSTKLGSEIVEFVRDSDDPARKTLLSALARMQILHNFQEIAAHGGE